MAPRPCFPLLLAVLLGGTATATAETVQHWRGVAEGGREDWWGAGDPAHCVEYQQQFPDAVKVAVDIAGFAVCGRPGEAVCDDVELTPVANMTCEGAVPHFFDDCGLICPVGMFICFFAIVTNTLCVVGVFGAPDVLAPSRQTVLLIGLQSLTDFVMAFACTASYAPTFYNNAWQGGESACSLLGAILHCCAVATILSMCVLTYIRYQHLVVGAAKMQRFTPPTPRRLGVWYGLVWFLSSAYAVGPILANGIKEDYGRYVLHPQGGTCYAETRGATFNIYLTIFWVGASSAYLVFAYGKMFAIVRKFMRSKAKTYTHTHGAGGAVNSAQARARHQGMVAGMKKQVKVLRMLVVIAGVYVANWAFALAQFVMGAAGYETPPLLSLWTAVGAITNSAINPLIYWFMNQKFRETCTATWRRACAGAARTVGLPDPVRYYDKRRALRSVAPTGFTGPETVASATGTIADATSKFEPAAGSVDLAESSKAASMDETGPGSSSPQRASPSRSVKRHVVFDGSRIIQKTQLVTVATAAGGSGDASSTPSLTSKKTDYRTSQKSSAETSFETTTVSSAANTSIAADSAVAGTTAEGDPDYTSSRGWMDPAH